MKLLESFEVVLCPTRTDFLKATLLSKHCH